MARVTVTTSPSTAIPARTGRVLLELVNSSSEVMYIRHGAAVDITSDSACGIPMAPGTSRAVTGAQAAQAMSAQLTSGAAPQLLYFEEAMA